MKREVPQGYKVFYHHERCRENGQIAPRGGITVAVLVPVEEEYDESRAKEDERNGISDEERPVAIGVARCHPMDNYTKAIGKDIALARAIDSMPRRTVTGQITMKVNVQPLLDAIKRSTEEYERAHPRCDCCGGPMGDQLMELAWVTTSAKDASGEPAVFGDVISDLITHDLKTLKDHEGPLLVIAVQVSDAEEALRVLRTVQLSGRANG
jgi:hypothetical protein